MISALIITILFLLGLILTAAAWIAGCLLIEIMGWRRDRENME